MSTFASLSDDDVRKQAKKDGITHLSTGVAVVRDGKVLIVRRAAHDYLGGNYELPGGGVDEGESLDKAAIREVLEETGLKVKRLVRRFQGFDYTTDKKPLVRQINFVAEVDSGNVKLNPTEHDAYLWVTDKDLELIVMSENMKRCILGVIKPD